MDWRDEVMSEIVYGRRVNLTWVAAVYRPTTNRSSQTYRMQALVFCSLSRLLFVKGDNGVGFSSLITIVEQLEVGRTPMPLYVGQMITSLDVMKKNPKGKF